MKPTLIVNVGEELLQFFDLFDYIVQTDQRPLSRIANGLVILPKERQSSLRNYANIKVNAVDTIDDLFKNKIPNYTTKITQEGVLSGLDVDSGNNYIFAGLAQDKVFNMLLGMAKGIKDLGKSPHNDLYLVCIVNESSFLEDNLGATLSTLKLLDEMSFVGLKKKIILTDKNAQGRNVKTKDIIANYAVFVYMILSENTMGWLDVSLKQDSMVGGSTELNVDYVSFGNCSYFLPIPTLRCEITNKLSLEFTKYLFSDAVNDHTDALKKEYDEFKKPLVDLISYKSILSKLSEIAKKIVKEGRYFGRLKLNSIAFDSLVESITEYQVLLLKGELHSLKSNLTKYVSSEDNIIVQNFMQKLQTFQSSVMKSSRLGFLSLKEDFRYLKNDIEMGVSNLRVVRDKKKKDIVPLVSEKYREKLTEKIKKFPKAIPYFSKFSLLAIFIGYLSFLIAKMLFYNNTYKMLLTDFIGGTIGIGVLLVASFVFWKKKRNIMFLAEQWKEDIESNYLLVHSLITHEVAEVLFNKEIEMVEDKSRDIFTAISDIEKIVFSAFEEVTCPKPIESLRVVSIGGEYYSERINDLIGEKREFFNDLIKESMFLKNEKVFEEPESVSNVIVGETKKRISNIIEKHETLNHLNLSNFIHSIANNDNKQNIFPSFLKNCRANSTVLIELEESLVSPNLSPSNQSYILLPSSFPDQENNRILDALPKSMKNRTIQNTNFMSIFNLIYDFPVRSMFYMYYVKSKIADRSLNATIEVTKLLDSFFGNGKQGEA